MKAVCGILAGEPEVIGERCKDGGACHHKCEGSCFRENFCSPLSLSGLNEKWEAGEETQLSPLNRVRDAINEYYAALDNRQHGGVAASNAFEKIQTAMGMHWVPGASKQEK